MTTAPTTMSPAIPDVNSAAPTLGNSTPDEASAHARQETPDVAADEARANAPDLSTEDIVITDEPDTEFTPQVDADPAELLPPVTPLTRKQELTLMAKDTTATTVKFLRQGGPSIWAIAALSVITLALILWKIWRLALIGAWSRGKSGKAVAAYENGDYDRALATVKGRMGIRSKVVAAALGAIRKLPEDRAREETARVAKREIANAGGGLRALELIATIAPLLGLLGTVLGMISAFQALQQAGSQADPALLAGGIWEALLTTAAGMAVAIPASAALTWFEAVIDRIRRDVEDAATRLFIASEPHQPMKLAAE
ncbi:MAG: MotA/TolQ/ExbB proton channel family protein [Rhodobacteraceae bacterium]|nr:MotA/TolQ/ExbB proton channel family protein [Paracoccaceae bacterium]